MARKADCGSSSPESSAKSSRNTSSSKTSPRLPVEGSTSFLATLPASGTMRNGRLFPLNRWGLLTEETGSSCLRGVPTPTVNDSRNGRNSTASRSAGAKPVNQGDTLVDFVTKWPTPTSRDWRSGKASEATMARNSRPLSEVVGGLLSPQFVEWLMGFCQDWTDVNESRACDALGMRSSRK